MLSLDGWPVKFASSTVLYMLVCGGLGWMASTKRFACGGGLVVGLLVVVWRLSSCSWWLWLSSCSSWLVALFMLLVVGGSSCFWWPACCDVGIWLGSTSGMDGMEKAECASMDGIRFWRFLVHWGRGEVLQGEACRRLEGCLLIFCT
ncbi:unnamed protein product [Meloidogyne enterolobii]|uniref:Uncharacterized protein n=1 Tax=Meloidogyne enterolobii TaxID=390850 RepID=A0ACB0ZG76_MELEN